MKNTALKISIVIPAYNEEGHIGACLEAISRLEVKPLEVIVVDNMSTDNTAKIAEQFPFVTLVKEAKQGVVHARDRGFDLAGGDIIGRIDADTLLPADWTILVARIFDEDSEVQAVSGSLHYYDIGLSQVVDWLDSRLRGWVATKLAPRSIMFLLGSNMAIRRQAWQQVEAKVCHERGLHEDLDLSVHLSEANLKVIYAPAIKVTVSARRVDTNLIDFAKYCFSSPETYFRHHTREHFYMYPVITFVLLNYFSLRFLFRAFDNQAQRFSLRTLFLSSSAARVNPADLA